MAKDIEARFHETWLGEVQPSEGLTFTVPVLCDAGAMVRLSAAQGAEFGELLVAADEGAGEGDGDREGEGDGDAEPEQAPSGPRVASVRALMLDFLGFTAAELHGAPALPEDLVLRLADEGTELRPTLAVERSVVQPGAEDDEDADAETAVGVATQQGEQTPASRAGQAYQLLVWELPPGLDLDAPESETTAWHYPPTGKLERLLRETRVPMGLLSNGEVVRLLYCPPAGDSTGWVSFPVGYMATPAGRDLLSAFRELLHADRVLGGMPDTPTTLQLLERSRARQADVTTRLGQQVLDALQGLLAGFEAAARRDGEQVLREAMRQEGDHVYEGLLTVMLRLVFAIYAEDRGLVPREHPVYAAHLSVSGLHDQLQADADVHGDTMEQRFGAWPRLVMLFRALYFGLRHGELEIPPHRGRLFNPEEHPFLEGRVPGQGAPVGAQERASTRLPSISDGVVLRVLRRLLYLGGQRLSYQALEEEQLGSVYEGLMGFTVERRFAPSVCLRPSRVWVSPQDLLDKPAATRVRWLQDNGVTASAAKRLAKGVRAAEKEHGAQAEGQPEALEPAVLEVLRTGSVAARRTAGRGGSRSDEVFTAEVAAGRLVVQPGEERRRTSSHYTPRSLSGPIVQRTLEPLLAAMRERVRALHPEDPDPQPTAQMLLSLKVCDPAMGSGAFLVEACRFLAKQVEAAWVREGTLEQVLREAGGGQRDPGQVARRVVAQQCLYGVDKNPLAVELGKLSLWLLTLARGQTFAFLDHCLKAGDSLVGLSRAQILAMDWVVEDGDEGGGARGTTGKTAKRGTKAKRGRKKKGKKAAGAGAGAGTEAVQFDLFAEQTRRAFEKAGRARDQLGALARQGDGSATERKQRELHIEAERELERLRDVADVLLSAYFWPDDDTLTPEFLFEGNKPKDKARRACLVRLRDELSFWLADAEQPPLPRALAWRRELVREGIRPMHWELEFPEVFSEDRVEALAVDRAQGVVWMDAVVGNPPFAGKNGITANGGVGYLDWLTSAYEGSHGNADLSAYFFRRARWLLGAHGTLGLIATNTIGQGDTRTTGLQAIVRAGGTIYEAVRDMKWPVRGANVSVSIVHVAVGKAAADGLVLRLDGVGVGAINSRLRGAPERADPRALAANSGKSFIGSYVLGMGFVLTPEEREELVASDERNGERIFPYLGGEELNSSPTQSHRRYVINFEDLSLEQAGRWPELLSVLRKRVKPERDKARHSSRPWWLFERPRSELYRAMTGLRCCVVTARVTKHLNFSLVSKDQVLNEKVVVVPDERYSTLGILQSRVHIVWAWLLSSTMRSDLNYTPSDCFETFPFPDPPTLAPDAPLKAIAKTLYETRAAFMVETDQGLTKTYNALKDPDDTRPEIEHLRRLHEQLDRAVLDAYGQPGITVPPYVGGTEAELERFEDEVLDFLFALNELRAGVEAKQR